MLQTRDVHQQFADYFPNPTLAPYLYLLSKRFSEGHICLDLTEIDTEELKEANYPAPVDPAELKRQKQVGTGDALQPFILNNNKLYLQRYFNYETVLFEKIEAFIAEEKDQQSGLQKKLREQKEALTALFPKEKDDNNRIDWQLVACISVVMHQLTIITGGPGTGKTTTIAKILSLLYTMQPNLKVVLAAPTGKAANRMEESLKVTLKEGRIPLTEKIGEKLEALSSSTLHRLLKSRPGEIYFNYNKDHPLPYDLLIVDESSMIDLALFAKLLEAVRPKTKILLLGDKDQLASVEAGSLFGDLCSAQPHLNRFSRESTAFINQLLPPHKAKLQDEHCRQSRHPLFEHVIELQHSYRFSDDEGIGRLSKAVIHNDLGSLKDFFIHNDHRIHIDTAYENRILLDFVEDYAAYIEESDFHKAFQKLQQLRVLCAVREGPQGLYALNNNIEQALEAKGLIKPDSEFYEHRPIIITSNNYELGLFNGDIGIIRKDKNGQLKAYFENGTQTPKIILPGLIEAAETAFALTIHKSQGSEFDKVFIVLPDYEDNPLLTRELLYTAITRAREHVTIQGGQEVIVKTCATQVRRGSGIGDRLALSQKAEDQSARGKT